MAKRPLLKSKRTLAAASSSLPKSKGSFGLRVFRLAAYLMAAAGVLMLCTVLAIKGYTLYEQQKYIRQYLSAPYTSALPAQGEDPSFLPDTGDLLSGQAQGQLTLIGVLSIPKIHLNVAIGQGVNGKTLHYTIGHFPSTALPGAKGNCALIGHRSYTRGQFFNRLDELTAGDLISLQHNGATYTYTVTDKYVVAPTDVWVLDPAEDAELTLITCTPIRIATHRLIIKAKLVP